jgi:hypothetical protein
MVLRLLFTVLFIKSLTIYSQIKINEFSSSKGFIDENGKNVDWIELVNIGNNVQDLSDYYLSDNINNLTKWKFSNHLISPNEKILICASGNNNNYVPNHWESLVKAQNTWKYWLGFSEPPSNWNQTSFDDQLWNSGIGGFGYGDNDDNTITNSNATSIYLRIQFSISDIADLTHLLFHADYDDGFVAYLNGSEIMRSLNFDVQTPLYNTLTTSDHEAVLYNGGVPESILLNNGQLSSLVLQGNNVLAIQVHNTSTTSSDMSSNFFLSAGISSSNYNYQSLPSWLNPPLINPHSNFQLSSGDKIVLSSPNVNVLDSISVPNDLTNGLSIGRSPDGTGGWCYFDSPSPKTTNGSSWCYDGIIAPPSLSVSSGWYLSPFQLSKSTNGLSSVYYTQNGDVPGTSDQQFTTPILISSSGVISVKAFPNNGVNMLPSKVVDRTYIFNQDNHNLSVFSLITDDANLWDYNTGIYVSGPGASTDYPYFGSNFWQPWSKLTRLEYFDSNKIKRVEAVVDLEIHGGWSRAEPQRSFRIDTKSTYTGDIEWPVIPEKSFITDFNNFNLRNGGQHTWSDKIQDAVISRVVKSTNVDRMSYEPSIVYLNGDYWGIYGIREKFDEHYIEDNHGIDADSVDLISREAALAGTNSHFIESYNLIMSANVNDIDFYSLFKSRFDVDNYIDYFTIQTFIQNMDWMGIQWGLNNTKLWRPQTDDGKWRYMLFDTDASYGYFGQNIYENYMTKARNPIVVNKHSQIFNKILLNSQFKCQFNNRYNDLVNTIFQNDNVSYEAMKIKGQLYNAMPDHITRWLNSGTQTISSVNQWENAINTFVQYNNSRLTTAANHLNQSLGLNGKRNVSIDVNPISSGFINLNTITPNSYPWDGDYSDGCPITISAIADSGFVFSHWDNNTVTSINPTNPNITTDLPSNISFKANFIACSEVILVDFKKDGDNLYPEISDLNYDISYAWYSNGVLLSTDSVLLNVNSGEYQLIISTGGCVVSSDVKYIYNDEFIYDIFPNPTVESLNVVFTVNKPQDVKISLFNNLGQVVLEKNFNDFVGQFQETISLSKFARDVYYFQLETNEGSFLEKLVLIK